MRVINGQVEITAADLEMFRNMGCAVSMHTEYYANHIVAFLPDGTTIGFHNWLSNADCYVGDCEIKIKDDKHLNNIVALMRVAIDLVVEKML